MQLMCYFIALPAIDNGSSFSTTLLSLFIFILKSYSHLNRHVVGISL